jgi:hypothetical protein
VLIAETGPVTERLRVRGIDDDKDRRLAYEAASKIPGGQPSGNS